MSADDPFSLRLNPLKPMTKIQAFQHLYLFILLAFSQR